MIGKRKEQVFKKKEQRLKKCYDVVYNQLGKIQQPLRKEEKKTKKTKK